jgi:predicted ATP-grasp superfamily ATP-dependent carboligase
MVLSPSLIVRYYKKQPSYSRPAFGIQSLPNPRLLTRVAAIVTGFAALGRGHFDMQVFLYEFATGGGLTDSQETPSGPLLAEGAAMIQALMADFSALADVEVVTTRDFRLPAIHPQNCCVTQIASPVEELLAIQRLAASADWTLLIAPETANALFDRARLVESAVGRLLSPSSECIKIASSKQATADLLDRAGISVPKGRILPGNANALPRNLQFPVVIKPPDGCASQGVRLIRTPTELPDLSDDMRIEEFIPGLPASVSVLCGPAGNHALPACEQRLSSDGQFKYLGGRLPVAPELDARAHRLALAAAKALPQPRGYVGVDLVLGNSPDGAGDSVIEINPRLTTSYVGLRAAARANLAAAMLAIATGHQPHITFTPHRIKFTADGTLT